MEKTIIELINAITCCICMEKYIESVVKWECGHKTCQKCFDRMASQAL